MASILIFDINKKFLLYKILNKDILKLLLNELDKEYGGDENQDLQSSSPIPDKEDDNLTPLQSSKAVGAKKARHLLTDDFIYGSNQILKRSRLESYRQGKTKDKFAIENNEITASKLIIGLNIVMYIMTKGLPGFTNGDSRSK